MHLRFASIWFRHLATDWETIRQPELKDQQFVLAAPERNRMVVKAASQQAQDNGIEPEMVVADARAIFPDLEVINEKPEEITTLLISLAEWCIRYSPIVAIDPPDGLILNITGCTHLWKGEENYLAEIAGKLGKQGYQVRVGIADTIGAAWAMAHFGAAKSIVPPDHQVNALLSLPPAALRIEPAIVEKLHKLGLYQIRNFIHMPRPVLRRRFGQQLLDRLDQATGHALEIIEPVQPIVPYQERLPCMEPIVTATGIAIALKILLKKLCKRFLKEGKGLRKAIFKGYRVDGKIVQIDIVTNCASNHREHLFKLFELKIQTLRPALGIELFVIEAPEVEDVDPVQESIWNISGENDRVTLMELLDRLAGRAGMQVIRRFLPVEHYWPERSVSEAASLKDPMPTPWRTDRFRPVQLLAIPEKVFVTSMLPDYPPILFNYRGKVHMIRKADGPERIESEWWLEEGEHRDYYCVEDQHGARYWIFRLGHYEEDKRIWFIHGFFV
ncbi:DNA polymerase Y family protein [Dyadobacter sp. Leaf189]|uniref:Y-family DNA polymerase n=1 Tax=Dyadobacter sp. Leaf189 TaxID=1736295 RepID=UPI0006FEA09B|nr:DNA polymerase Y family protein [Dyadobacter sp. Leaf189]KQS30979.1 nucleotidyltransferase [Dyadobacter sp. Leaf189]